MSGLAEKLYFIILPPTSSSVDAEHQVLVDTTGNAAADFDWYAQLVTAGAEPKGKCFVTLEAVTTDVYVRFGPTATTATTADNGRLVKAGQPGVSFYVNPTAHGHIDHIAPAGAGKLKLQVTSPIGERKDV